MPTHKVLTGSIVFLVIAALLLSPSLGICVDTGKIKDKLLEKARDKLIARLEKTQPQLANFFKQIDAPTWGRYAGEISAGNGQAVFDEIFQQKKKEFEQQVSKEYEEMMDDLYKKGKERAISKGVFGPDTKKYIELVETYKDDALAMAEKAYGGDYKGAGDVVMQRMKKELQAQAEKFMTGIAASVIDSLSLQDIMADDPGAIFMKIIKLEMAGIEKFEEYTRSYFGTFPVLLSDGTWKERDFCTQYMEMRKRGHDPQTSFSTIDPKAGNIYGMDLSISELVEQKGFWYGTSVSKSAKERQRTFTGEVTHPDAQELIKKFELCYIQSKVPDETALNKLIADASSYASTKLFTPIKEGMDERRVQIVLIINSVKIQSSFTILVTVTDSDTGNVIPGANVTLGGLPITASSGTATFMIDPDSMSDPVSITAEATGYDSSTQSFSKDQLADSMSTDTEEVQVKLTLKLTKKSPEDFMIDVSVNDKNTGNPITGAKVTLAGETKDAPSGVASFTRKSSMLDPTNSANQVSLSAEADGYKPGSSSLTAGELAGKFDKGTNKATLSIALEPQPKVDEVDRIEVHCDPKEILEGETSTCKATLYFKSGKSKDVSAASTWTPGFVDSTKGAIKGQDVKAAHSLPYTVTAEATYLAPAEEGGKSWTPRDAVLVKPAAPTTAEAQPQIKIQKTPSAQNIKAGETVTYTYAVTNPGKVELGSVAVSDDACSPLKFVGGDTNNNNILDSGETWTYQCSATLNTTTENTATVQGYTQKNARATDTAKAKVTVGPTPPWQVDEIDRIEVRCGPNEMFEDESAICNAKVYFKSGKSKDVNLDAKWTPDFVDASHGTLRGQDVKAMHPLPYTVSVEAKYLAPAGEGGKSWAAHDTVLVKPAAPPTAEAPPHVKIQKVSGTNWAKPGETVTYAYSVTNTGQVELSSVKVADDKCSPLKLIGGDTNKNNVLDPGETWNYECSTVLRTSTENTATVEGFTPKNVRATDTATAKVAVGPCPPPQVQVPYVLSMSENDGMTELEKNSLKGNVTGRESSTKFAEGVIMEQDPNAGECVDPNSTVSLVVSKGPEPEAPAPPSALEAKLDCNGFLELLPGQVSESCGVMVRNWRSDTTTRVEVVYPQQTSMGGDLVGGIVVFPGTTSSDPTNMHVAGVQDPNSPYYGYYTFSEGFSAKQDAAPGTFSIDITVRQGDQQVVLKLTVTVLPKGATRSTGPGLRPPAVVKQGSGGPYCVWRHHELGDAPNCFELSMAACNKPPPSPDYELVGQNMNTAEADARIAELSRYFGDQYGCEGAPAKPEGPPPPPAEVKQGSGGVYCVWRVHGFGDAPNCFQFSSRPCANGPPGPDYELVGQNMTGGEGDARIEELSRYFSDQYGCEGAPAKPEGPPPPPAEVKQGSGGDRCVWRNHMFGDAPNCFHFWNAPCNKQPPGPNYELVGQNMTWGEADARIEELSRYFKDQYDCEAGAAQLDCSNIAGSSPVLDKASGKMTCQCPPDKVKNKAETACITNPDKQVAETDCSGQKGTAAKWDPDTEQVSCECPEGTTLYNNACMSDKDIKMAKTDCGDRSPQWNPETQQVDCVCPAGTTPFKDSCLSDKDLKMAQACISLPGGVARWNDATQQADCVCPPDRRLYQNACMTEQEIATLAAAGTISPAQLDCTPYPGTSAQWDQAAGQYRCTCPTGMTFNQAQNKCVAKQLDCTPYPGTSAQWDQAAGQYRCTCPTGMTFNQAQNKCVAKQLDCTPYPGTSAQWDQAAGQYRCTCPTGMTFDQAQNKCVAKQLDCTPYPGTSAQWDQAAGQYRCTCSSDMKFDQAQNKCVAKQLDCRPYPGTSAQWDQAAGQYRCTCPTGMTFNQAQNKCVAKQLDCRPYPGTSAQWDQAAGQYRCTCPTGMTFNQAQNKCVAKQLDCRPYPGTSPQWDQAAGQYRCTCPSNMKFDQAQNKCVAKQLDCSRYPGTSPQWDQAAGQYRCTCPSNMKFDQAQNKCVAKQLDCSRYPGTSPQWDQAAGQYRCTCPSNMKFDQAQNKCVAKQPQKPSAPPPPKPAPPPAPPPATSGGQCDPPICTDLCMRNCESLPNAMGGNCSASCNLVPKCGPAEKEAAKSLAKVKAACYTNILNRCNQGQSGRTGNWCVGPGADITCVARAHSICGCDPKTHPSCGGKWE